MYGNFYPLYYTIQEEEKINIFQEVVNNKAGYCWKNLIFFEI